jgi:hypothetical protein
MPYKQGSGIRSIVTRHNGNTTALDRLDNHTCITFCLLEIVETLLWCPYVVACRVHFI